MTNTTNRSQGCLLGMHLAAWLSSRVLSRFCSAIRMVRELADGGTWNTIAGQPTDDSELALLLARMLAERGPMTRMRL